MDSSSSSSSSPAHAVPPLSLAEQEKALATECWEIQKSLAEKERALESVKTARSIEIAKTIAKEIIDALGGRSALAINGDDLLIVTPGGGRGYIVSSSIYDAVKLVHREDEITVRVAGILIKAELTDVANIHQIITDEVAKVLRSGGG